MNAVTVPRLRGARGVLYIHPNPPFFHENDTPPTPRKPGGWNVEGTARFFKRG